MLIMLSCGNSKNASESEKDKIVEPTVEEATFVEEKTQSPEDFTILIQHVYGGLDNNEQRVITNAKSLSEVYGIINRFRKPGVSVPEIDFNKNIVVALFMGEKNTSGYSTEVDAVSITGDEMIIGIKENGPKPTDVVSMAICQPFCFVMIPRPEGGKSVVFKKQM